MLTTGKKFLVAGGSVLLAKGLYLSILLLAGVLAPEVPVVLGAVAESLIGLGIVLADLVEPAQHRHAVAK